MTHDLNHPRRTYLLAVAIPVAVALVLALVLRGYAPEFQTLTTAMVPSAFAFSLLSLIVVACTEGHIGTTVWTFQRGLKRSAFVLWITLTIMLSATVCAMVPIVIIEALTPGPMAQWWAETLLLSTTIVAAIFIFLAIVTRAAYNGPTGRKMQRPNPLAPPTN